MDTAACTAQRGFTLLVSPRGLPDLHCPAKAEPEHRSHTDPSGQETPDQAVFNPTLQGHPLPCSGQEKHCWRPSTAMGTGRTLAVPGTDPLVRCDLELLSNPLQPSTAPALPHPAPHTRLGDGASRGFVLPEPLQGQPQPTPRPELPAPKGQAR